MPGVETANPMKLKLKGLTKKGKQRVKQHGEWWLVVDMGTPQCCGGDPAYMIKPMDEKRQNDIRWILTHGDIDFEIEEEKGYLIIDMG